MNGSPTGCPETATCPQPATASSSSGKRLKRLLFLGDHDFFIRMRNTTLPIKDNLLICYTSQTKMAISLAGGQAVDLIVIDVTSVPLDKVDQLTGSPRPEDVDATAPYEEPEVDVPDGVEFYAFNPFEENVTQKLLAKLEE